MQAPRRLQLRRGNTAAVSSYVGAPGELVINTDTNTILVHNGSTVGGIPVTTNTASITSNVSALQSNVSTLTANAGAQAGSIATLTSNAAVQAGLIATLQSDVTTLTANAGAQAGSIATLTGNAAVQAGLIADLQANAGVQAGAIVTANTAMKGYVDAAVTGIVIPEVYGNANVAAYLTNPSTALSSLNVTTAGIAQINGTNPGSELVIQSGGLHNFNFRSSGNLEIPGSIIPTANVAYSLGNITHQWKDLFVSNNTIYIGGVPLSVDASGNLIVNGSVVGGNIVGITSINASVSTSAINDESGDFSYGSLSYDYAVNGVTAGGFTINYSAPLVHGNVDVNVGNVIASNITTTNGIFWANGQAYSTGSNYGNSNVASYLTGFVGNIGNLTLRPSGEVGVNYGTRFVLGNPFLQQGIQLYATNDGTAFISHRQQQAVGTFTVSSDGVNYGILNLRAEGSVNGEVRIVAPTGVSAGVWIQNIKYPNSDGTAGQILTTNGAGVLGWTTTFSNSNVASYLPTYSGNLSAGGYVGIAGQDGTTVVDFQTGAGTNQIISLGSDYTFNIKAGNGAGNRGHLVLESGQNSRVVIHGNGSNVQVTAGNGTSSGTWTFNTNGNLTLPSNIAAINYANGVSILSGLGSGGTTYSNTNVAAYLTTANITTTGNITAAWLSGNISITGNVVGTSPNVTIQAGSYSSTFNNQGNVILPNLAVSGNVISGGYFVGNGSQLTGLNTVYLLEAYASVTYTLPGSFTEDPCRYSVVSSNVNVSSSWFDTSTYTFTPQKAGYWEITAAYDVYRNAESSLAIKKNNSIVASAGSFNAVAQQITKIIYLNGSTDSANVINVGGAALSRSQYDGRSWFQARWIGP